MKSLIVIDASVILKWVLPPAHEPHQTQAEAIAEAILESRISVALPGLWYFEVGNILIRKYPAHAAKDLADLSRHLLMFEKTMSADWQSRILDLTTRYRITFYDAAYHALAMVNGGIFVTADEKYLQAVAGEPNVIHLKDWP